MCVVGMSSARQEAEASLISLRAKYEALVESSAESERSLREALDKANATYVTCEYLSE